MRSATVAKTSSLKMTVKLRLLTKKNVHIVLESIAETLGFRVNPV